MTRILKLWNLTASPSFLSIMAKSLEEEGGDSFQGISLAQFAILFQGIKRLSPDREEGSE